MYQSIATLPNDPDDALAAVVARISELGYAIKWEKRDHPITLPKGLFRRRGVVKMPAERKFWESGRLVPGLAHELVHVEQQVAGRMGRIGVRYLVADTRCSLEAEAYRAQAFVGTFVGGWSFSRTQEFAQKIAGRLASDYALRRREHRGRIIDAILDGGRDGILARGEAGRP